MYETYEVPSKNKNSGNAERMGHNRVSDTSARQMCNGVTESAPRAEGSCKCIDRTQTDEVISPGIHGTDCNESNDPYENLAVRPG